MARPGRNEKLSPVVGGMAKTKSGQKLSDLIAKKNDSFHLRNLRKKRGYTLNELGELTGLSPSYISRLEAGGRRLNSDLIVKLSTTLGCSEYDLIKSHIDTNENEKPIKSREGAYLPTKDLPIYKSIAGENLPGGKKSSLPVANFDEPESKTFRLPQLMGSRSAFGVYVVDDSNFPKYRIGDLILIQPDKSISPGASVFMLTQDNEVVIGELISWSDDIVEVKKFKEGSKAQTYNRKDLLATYGILCTMELHKEA